jgi:hypothetical protein
MANGQLKYGYNAATRTLTWVIPECEPLELHLDEVHADNIAWAAVHGFKRRVADGAALSCDTATGKSATWAAKRESMAEIVDHLESGSAEWDLRARARGPRVDNELEFYVRALRLVYSNKSEEALEKWARGKSRAQRAAHLVESSAMREAAELLRLEMAEGIDTADMEAELEAI